MRRPKAWRGGSNAQQSCVPATALGARLYQSKIVRKSIENRSKIDQKSIKNRSRIDQKSIKNRPTIDQNHGWSEKCRAIRLGSIAPVGFQNRAHIVKKSMQKSIKKLMHLGMGFGGILMDFGNQNGGQLAPKSIKNRCQLRKAIF